MIGWLEVVCECCQLWKRGSLCATAPPPGVASQFKYCGGRRTTVIIIIVIITSVTWYEIHGSLKLSLHSALRAEALHGEYPLWLLFWNHLSQQILMIQTYEVTSNQNFKKVAGVHPKVPLFNTEHITSDVFYIFCSKVRNGWRLCSIALCYQWKQAQDGLKWLFCSADWLTFT